MKKSRPSKPTTNITVLTVCLVALWSHPSATRSWAEAEAGGERPQDLAARLAPVLTLHPDEDCFPVDPLAFIRASRFRHHKGGFDPDEGYNRTLEKWVVGNSHAKDFYDIPVEFINGYGPHDDGRNRRPADPNRGKEWNVFLQPKGEPVGRADFNKVVPAFWWWDAGNSVMQYWFFYGYNRGLPDLKINHQGDWEHVRIRVKDGKAVDVRLSAHGDLPTLPVGKLRSEAGRPVVFVAKGTHAMYAEPGTHRLGMDVTAEGGPRWDGWNEKTLLPLDAQPWKDYAGAWGQVGKLGLAGISPDTTGPLGPWHKRAERKDP